jgi:hypothetical protein
MITTRTKWAWQSSTNTLSLQTNDPSNDPSLYIRFGNFVNHYVTIQGKNKNGSHECMIRKVTKVVHNDGYITMTLSKDKLKAKTGDNEAIQALQGFTIDGKYTFIKLDPCLTSSPKSVNVIAVAKAGKGDKALVAFKTVPFQFTIDNYEVASINLNTIITNKGNMVLRYAKQAVSLESIKQGKNEHNFVATLDANELGLDLLQHIFRFVGVVYSQALLKSANLSWIYIDDENGRVTTTNSNLTLVYKGEVNGIQGYIIQSADGAIVGKTFTGGELYYDTMHEAISISMNTKTIYETDGNAAFFSLSTNLQKSSHKENYYYGAISYTETPSAKITKGESGYAGLLVYFLYNDVNENMQKLIGAMREWADNINNAIRNGMLIADAQISSVFNLYRLSTDCPDGSEACYQDLDFVSFIEEIEDLFSINISDDDADSLKIQTISDLLIMLRRYGVMI